MTTTNEMPYEEYKGFYLGPGITMPAQGIFEWNVYETVMDAAAGNPLREFSSKEEAVKWIDEHVGGRGEPKTEAERRETHHGRYGAEQLPDRGKGREETTVRCPICGDEIEVREYDAVTRSEALRRHLEEKHRAGGLHSIHGPERERLVAEYGTWAVGRAESVCPEDDVACVEREAARLSAKVRVGSAIRVPSYYWSVRVDDTNEVAEKAQAYSSVGRAASGAKAYARSQVRDNYWPTESSYTVRVYEAPAPAEAAPFREEGVVQENVFHGSELT